MVSYSTTIQTSIDRVWEHLLYKIERPEAFVPGVSEVLILEKNNEFVVRQMTITMNDVASKVLEKITFSPYSVRFELLEHPKFNGHVDNDAVFISENETQLTYTMNWIDKQTQIAFSTHEIMKNAVLKTKDFIESNI